MKLRIPRDELKVGMFIERAVLESSDKSKTGVDFIRKILIDSPEKLAKLQKQKIKFLIIDTAKAQKIEPKKVEEPKPEPVEKPPEVKEPEPEPEPVVEKVVEPEPEPEEPEEELLESFDDEPKKEKIGGAVVPFEKELEKAREIKDVAVQNVKNMLEDAASGKSFDSEPAKEQVNDIVKSVFRNKDAMLSLTRLKSFDEYTFTHCVNVTVLAIALARETGFTKKQVEMIGLGGMLHDVGKMKVPDAVLNKPGKLDPEERLIIQKHTTWGYDILKDRDDISDVAKLMALEHHERIDGSGYPNGKTEDQLQPESMLTGVVDVYDALTSARVYKPGMPPPNALSFIKSKAETEFRPEYVEKFMDVIGIFPVGSVIEFNTGQVGIVKEINRDNLYEPNVIMIMNARKQMLGTGRDVDSSKYEGAGLKIIRFHHPDDFGINVSDYLDLDTKRV